MHKLQLLLIFIFSTIAVQNIFSHEVLNNADFKPFIEIIKCYKCDDIVISLPTPKYPKYVGSGPHVYNGEVGIQITVDEKGNIESAKGISGHPYYRFLFGKRINQSEI